VIPVALYLEIPEKPMHAFWVEACPRRKRISSNLALELDYVHGDMQI